LTRCEQPENTAHQKMTGRRMSHCPNCGTVRRQRTRRNFEAIVVVMAKFVGHSRDVRFRAKFANLQQIPNRQHVDNQNIGFCRDVESSNIRGIVQRSAFSGASKGTCKKRSWQSATPAVERCLGDSTPFPRRLEADDRERRQGGDLANALRPLNAEH